jgi:hypothetical protein
VNSNNELIFFLVELTFYDLLINTLCEMKAPASSSFVVVSLFPFATTAFGQLPLSLLIQERRCGTHVSVRSLILFQQVSLSRVDGHPRNSPFCCGFSAIIIWARY